MSYVFNFYAGIPSEGVNITSPPSRPRAIRARSEGNSPRRHQRHRRHHRHRSRSTNDPQRGEIIQLQLHPEIGALPRMLRLFAVLHLLLYSIHRLDRLHPIEVDLRCVRNLHLQIDHHPNGAQNLICLRVYGSLAMGHLETRHHPARLDHGDLSHLDQWFLLQVFFLSLSKAICSLHKLREERQAPPPKKKRRNSRRKIRPQLVMFSTMLLQ